MHDSVRRRLEQEVQSRDSCGKKVVCEAACSAFPMGDEQDLSGQR